MAWELFLLSPGRVLRSALHFLYMIGGGIPEGDFGRPKGAGLVPPIPKNQKSPIKVCVPILFALKCKCKLSFNLLQAKVGIIAFALN